MPATRRSPLGPYLLDVSVGWIRVVCLVGCTFACPGRLGRAWTSRVVSVALAPWLCMWLSNGRAEMKGCCMFVCLLVGIKGKSSRR
jgi:hypothetical protein